MNQDLLDLYPDKKDLLNALIYEYSRDGKPIYYKDYKQVLGEEKTVDEIMGSSLKQGYMIWLISLAIGGKLNRKKYLISTNEIGFFTARPKFRLCDIAIFEKDKVRGMDMNKYSTIAPKIVIEVDAKASAEEFASPQGYIADKNRDLWEKTMLKTYPFETLFDDPSMFDPVEGQILKTKAFMLIHLRKHIRAQELNETQIALVFGISSEQAQKLQAMKIDAFSIDELGGFLDKIAIPFMLNPEVPRN